MSKMLQFYRSTIGKKVVVAITGLILFAFVLVHMIGNLQLYAGAEKLNAYAEFLQNTKSLLWTVRSLMLVMLGLHLVTTALLFLQNWGARPIQYRIKRTREIDYSSRTMVWTGPIIAAFVLYHLLHFTTGQVHPNFTPGDAYRVVVSGFQVWPVAVVYILANLLLGFHLKHGLWSWFQTLGLAHPRYNSWRTCFAWFLAGLIVVGNLSFPIAVLTGLVA